MKHKPIVRLVALIGVIGLVLGALLPAFAGL
jgi:hypothetical protein